MKFLFFRVTEIFDGGMDNIRSLALMFHLLTGARVRQCRRSTMLLRGSVTVAWLAHNQQVEGFDSLPPQPTKNTPCERGDKRDVKHAARVMGICSSTLEHIGKARASLCVGVSPSRRKSVSAAELPIGCGRGNFKKRNFMKHDNKPEAAEDQASPANHVAQNNPLHVDVTDVVEKPKKKQSAESILELPDDIKKNLVGFEDMEMEQLLLKSLAHYPHPINVDRVILTLWFNHEKKADRHSVMRRLRLMTVSGLVQKYEGVRGTYAITDQGKALLGT